MLKSRINQIVGSATPNEIWISQLATYIITESELKNFGLANKVG